MSFSPLDRSEAARGAFAPEALALPELFEGVLWRRILAYGVDVVILALCAAAVWLLFGTITVISFGLLSGVWILFPFIPLAYNTWLIGGPRSATVGMRLFDLEVRNWTGERPGYIQAAVQTALFYLTVSFTGGIILIVALFNARRRTLHDFVAGTFVIRGRPRGGGRSQ